MKQRLTPLFALVIFVALGCNGGSTKGSSTGTTSGGGTGGTTGTTSSAPEFPDSLKHAAYEYYGLGETRDKTYVVRLSAISSENDGTERTTYDGLVDGAETFTIARTGTLAQLGTETWQVDEEGLTIVHVSIGDLEEPSLQFPADFGLDKEWESEMTLDDGSRTITVHMDAKVVRQEEIETEAGTFDCLVVESDVTRVLTGTVGQDGESVMKMTAHYARDIGLIRMSGEGDQPNGDPVELFVELKKIGD